MEDKCDSLGKEVVNLNAVLSDAEEEKKRLLMEANQVRAVVVRIFHWHETARCQYIIMQEEWSLSFKDFEKGENVSALCSNSFETNEVAGL